MGTTLDGSVDVDDGTPWPRQVRAFALRSIRRFARNRSSVFWAVVAPVGYYLFFGVLNTTGSDAVGVVRGATAVSLGIFGALSATQMVFAGNVGADLREKRYRKLRSLPVSPWADLAGRFVAGFALGLAAFCAVVLVGVATGGHVAFAEPASIAVVLVSVFLLCVVGVGLAVVSAAFVQNSQHLMIVANALLLGLFFGTGYNGVAPELLPAALQPFVNLLPNSLATRLTILHLSPGVTAGGGQLTPPPLPTGVGYPLLLAGEAVVASALAALAMRRLIYEGEIDE